MAHSIINKEIFRSIKDSFARFIAITLIVALGCGFYAGLKNTSPDMLLSADAYYDRSNLCDLRVVATLGMEEEGVKAIESLPLVEKAVGAYEADVIAAIGSDQLETRVHSLTEGVNELSLEEGRLPESAGECVISADKVLSEEVHLGDSVKVEEEAIKDALAITDFTVVGIAHTPYYVSSVSMGATSLGAGSIDQFMYVTPDSFGKDFPITEAFITVKGAAQEQSGSEAYKTLVDEASAQIEAISAEYEQRRVDSIRAEAQEEVDKAKAELDDEEKKAQDALDEAKAKLDSAAEDISDNEKKLKDARAEYEKGVSSYESEKSSAEKRIDDAEKKIEQGKAALSKAKDELESSKAQFESTKSYMTDEQVKAAEKEFAKAKSQISSQEKSLSSAESELAANKKKADAELAKAKKQLDSAKKKISSGESQLEQGKAEYEKGLAEYEKEASQAKEEIEKGRAKIADAQQEVDDLDLEDDWLILDRTKNPGVESFTSDAERVNNIAQVFPLIFFLVAALVALTTMTRMIDEERMLIGTFKALGYSRAKIASKYMIYALAASGIGAVLGIVALSLILPSVIMEAYAIIYFVPHEMLMPIDFSVAALSASLGIGITLLTTWLACAATLRESPASLMLPRAPHMGKKILLEKIAPLWSHLSFLWKVTLRNIFRYKKRLFMTLIGIAGCTALLLTGFGLQDSINDIIDKQFGATVNYNVIVNFDDEEDAQASGPTVQDMLDASTYAQETNVCPISEDGKSYTATMVVPQDPEDFQAFWTFRTRVGQAKLELSEGAIVNEKLAISLDVEVGDEIVVAGQDEMGNPTESRKSIRVDGIMENYIADYVFMSPQAYEQAYSKSPKYETIFGIGDPDGTSREQLFDALHAVPGVKTVAFNDETIDSYRTMLKSVNMIVIVLVVSAAALAFIVLYNLTNINITERQREIATLKVLGFTRKEIYLYIFREIMILSVMGAVLGLLLGVFLEGFVVVTAEVDYVMFGREIHALSFLWSFLLTVLFSVIVMAFMRRRLDKIDMVESLKSVE